MDEAVLRKAIAGDSSAFAAVLDEYYDFIYRVAWRWCANKEEAEDITQDVCLKLARTLKSFQGKSSFKTWLYRVTLNQVRDSQRRFKRENEKTAQLLQETEILYAADDADQLSEALWQAVRTLPEALRDTVLLVYGEGVSHARAGEILQCAESTISWRLMEARKKLKFLMDEADI